MQNEIMQFFLQYVLVLFACNTFYLVGTFLLRLFSLHVDAENSKWLRTYSAFVLGIVVLVFIYSLLLAKGKTINIVFLPFFAGLFFLKRKNIIENSRGEIFKDWPFFFLIVIPFLFVLLFHLFPESEYKQIDSLHYLQISQSFNETGQENNFGALAKYRFGTIPYHYFEFWLNAILIKCFSVLLPGIQIFRFVCYGIIGVGILFGLFALAENIVQTKLTIAQKIFCVCFIFYIPNFLGYINFLKPVFIFPFENNILERPNLRTLYLFLPGVLITIGNSKYKWQSLFWLAGVIISSVLNFVVFLVVIPVFCVINLKNKGTRKYAFFLLASFFLTAIFYFLFYHFTSGKISIAPNGTTKNSIIIYCIKYWKLIIFSSAGSIFYCFLIPLVVLACINKKKRQSLFTVFQSHQTIILFISVIIFCAVFIARVLNFMEDSYQFAFLGYASGAILFFVLMLTISKLVEFKSWIYYLSCVFFLMSFLTMRFLFRPNKYKNVFIQNGSYWYGGKKYSNTYLQNILAVFPADSKVNGAFWADRDFYDSIPYYSNREPNLYGLPSRLVLANKLKYNFEVCLSDSASIMYGLDTSQKANYYYVRSAIERSTFYVPHGDNNINERRLKFIKENRLQYLILTKNADTTVVKKLPITQSFQDKVTGEKFYVIDDKVLVNANK